MPNGGEHYEQLGACPLCGSPSIRTRRQRHRRLLWRCWSCNGVFATPKVAEYTIPPGDDGRGYVFAESIPQMERRARLHGPQGSRGGRSRPFSLKLATAAAIVLLLGALGYLVIMSGVWRDGAPADQRPGLGESPIFTPSPPAIAGSGQTGVAMAIPTETPTITPIRQPFATPELVPTATETPTPTPTRQPFATPELVPTATETPTPTPTRQPFATPELVPAATETPTITPIRQPFATPELAPTAANTPTPTPTRQPFATPELVPTATNTPTPTPTRQPFATPELVPTATHTPSPRPSVSVLAKFENGRWLIQNRPALATSIAAIDWIEDGIQASESETVQELVHLAAFHEVLTASLIGLHWFADGVAETETEGLEQVSCVRQRSYGKPDREYVLVRGRHH